MMSFDFVLFLVATAGRVDVACFTFLFFIIMNLGVGGLFFFRGVREVWFYQHIS